jgi:hypothetical protein
MGKTLITMATVALTAGLFAGTALAGGGGNENEFNYCPVNNNAPLIGAVDITAAAPNNSASQVLNQPTCK